MENVKEIIKDKYSSSDIELERIYREKYNTNTTFRLIVNKLELPTETLLKYTSRIETSVKEINNCKHCKSLYECQNEVQGYVYYPIKNDNFPEFCYVPCKYKQECDKINAYRENAYYYNISNNLKSASMRDIETTDKNRFQVIKWINQFINNYTQGKSVKGLYLNGNFGCGKTYLLSAMLNELAKKNFKVAIIYYPEVLRGLKESFTNLEEYRHRFNFIKKVPLLLLDDLGAENVTEWSRDEVLGTILQYRMEENLPTFFTSNLTLEELEVHLSITSKEIDKVKARRIISRIKQLTESMTMISENRRK